MFPTVLLGLMCAFSTANSEGEETRDLVSEDEESNEVYVGGEYVQGNTLSDAIANNLVLQRQKIVLKVKQQTQSIENLVIVKTQSIENLVRGLGGQTQSIVENLGGLGGQTQSIVAEIEDQTQSIVENLGGLAEIVRGQTQSIESIKSSLAEITKPENDVNAKLDKQTQTLEDQTQSIENLGGLVRGQTQSIVENLVENLAEIVRGQTQSIESIKSSLAEISLAKPENVNAKPETDNKQTLDKLDKLETLVKSAINAIKNPVSWIFLIILSCGSILAGVNFFMNMSSSFLLSRRAK